MPDRIEVHGAGKPGIDYIEVPNAQETYLDALYYERAGWLARQAEGQTHYTGVPLTEALAANGAEIVRAGGRIPHAEFIGATVPEPPASGGELVKDRKTGEWREPKRPGRQLRDDA